MWTETHVSRRRLLRTGIAIGAGVAVAPVLLAGTAQAYPWSRTLQSGSTGADVRELQIRVAGWASATAAHTFIALDGDFGVATTGAVKRFQSAYGLGADGVVGPQTQAKLNALESSDGSTLHFNWSE